MNQKGVDYCIISGCSACYEAVYFGNRTKFISKGSLMLMLEFTIAQSFVIYEKRDTDLSHHKSHSAPILPHHYLLRFTHPS